MRRKKSRATRKDTTEGDSKSRKRPRNSCTEELARNYWVDCLVDVVEGCRKVCMAYRDTKEIFLDPAQLFSVIGEDGSAFVVSRSLEVRKLEVAIWSLKPLLAGHEVFLAMSKKISRGDPVTDGANSLQNIMTNWRNSRNIDVDLRSFLTDECKQSLFDSIMEWGSFEKSRHSGWDLRERDYSREEWKKIFKWRFERLVEGKACRSPRMSAVTEAADSNIRTPALPLGHHAMIQADISGPATDGSKLKASLSKADLEYSLPIIMFEAIEKGLSKILERELYGIKRRRYLQDRAHPDLQKILENWPDIKVCLVQLNVGLKAIMRLLSRFLKNQNLVYARGRLAPIGNPLDRGSAALLPPRIP